MRVSSRKSYNFAVLLTYKLRIAMAAYRQYLAVPPFDAFPLDKFVSLDLTSKAGHQRTAHAREVCTNKCPVDPQSLDINLIRVGVRVQIHGDHEMHFAWRKMSR